MKHIKLYENYTNKDIHIGDYVIVNVDNLSYPNYKKFVNNNIGKVTNIHPSLGNCPGGFATIEYENIPQDIIYRFDTNNLEKNTTVIAIRDIIYFSKEKKDIDIQTIIASKKYNL